jgi:hypothetical protein
MHEWCEVPTNTYLDHRYQNWLLAEEFGDVVFVPARGVVLVHRERAEHITRELGIVARDAKVFAPPPRLQPARSRWVPRLSEAAFPIQRNRGAVRGRGPDIQILGGKRARSFRRALHQGGGDAAPTLSRVDEHPDQDRRMVGIIRVAGDSRRHADEPPPRQRTSRDRTRKRRRQLARARLIQETPVREQGSSRGHRRLGPGTQTQRPESETFVRAQPPCLDRRPAGPHTITPASSARPGDRTRSDAA